MWMEDFAVACQLVPTVPHLISGSCSSPRTFAPRFLQTPPRGDALALHLSFGSTHTWTGDFHPQALRHARHTRQASGAAGGRRLHAVARPCPLPTFRMSPSPGARSRRCGNQQHASAIAQRGTEEHLPSVVTDRSAVRDEDRRRWDDVHSHYQVTDRAHTWNDCAGAC